MRKSTLAFLLATTLFLSLPAAAADAPPETGPIVDLGAVVEMLLDWLGLESEAPDPPEGPPGSAPESPGPDDGGPTTEFGPGLDPNG